MSEESAHDRVLLPRIPRWFRYRRSRDDRHSPEQAEEDLRGSAARGPAYVDHCDGRTSGIEPMYFSPSR